MNEEPGIIRPIDILKDDIYVILKRLERIEMCIGELQLKNKDIQEKIENRYVPPHLRVKEKSASWFWS